MKESKAIPPDDNPPKMKTQNETTQHTSGPVSWLETDHPVNVRIDRLEKTNADLLAALIDLVSPYDGNQNNAPTSVKLARAAIARARATT